MRALYVSTRLAGTDGVSLENAKLLQVLEEAGFSPHMCAGELDADGPPGTLLPELHFRDPVALELGGRFFGDGEADPALRDDLRSRARELRAALGRVVDDVRPDLLVLQNVWAVPMQLPLAEALAGLVADRGIPTLSHEHDYHWERERFASARLPAYLDTYFPFDAPSVHHLAINSLAASALARRRGVAATVLPNVLDFDTPAPELDAFAATFRDAIGLMPGQRLILQPTRVIPRKGIELSIDLLAELGDPRNVLVITHAAGDEGLDYLRALEARARERAVDVRLVDHLVGASRAAGPDGRARFALWDTYPHADLVTYPSLYEGFGNALLETIWFNKAALVNRYGVYAADIAPKGFRFVEIDGEVTPAATRAVAALLEAPGEREAMAAHNYRLAREHFGYDALRRIVVGALDALGLPTGR
jgi:mannosylglucosylglycerate synthase